jgi:hypothetical protein
MTRPSHHVAHPRTPRKGDAADCHIFPLKAKLSTLPLVRNVEFRGNVAKLPHPVRSPAAIGRGRGEWNTAGFARFERVTSSRGGRSTGLLPTGGVGSVGHPDPREAPSRDERWGRG